MTVPDQPAYSFSEGILKTSTPLTINVISSFNGNNIMSIPFNKIRRFGCQLAIDKDIVWFETCGCKDQTEEFQFFIVALGIERAYQIVQEYKRSLELALRDHMIMEEGDQSQFLFSYVVKSHYGHSDYPEVQRERILQSSILSLSTSGGSLSLSELNKFTRSRPSFPAMNTSGPIPGDMGGVPYSGGRGVSPSSPSPSSPVSPTHPYGQQQQGKQKLTLSQFQKSPRPSRTSFQSSAPTEFDSGVSIDGPIDPSRHSAPCYIDGSQHRSPQSNPRLALHATGKGKSFDGVRKISSPGSGSGVRKISSPSSGRNTLQDFTGTSRGSERLNMSLGQLQLKGGIQAFNSQRKGTDSALGSGSELNQAPYSRAGSGGPRSNPYDHLPGNGVKNNSAYAYDHLADNVRVTPPTPSGKGGGGFM